jgi:hypothetical protein
MLEKVKIPDRSIDHSQINRLMFEISALLVLAAEK